MAIVYNCSATQGVVLFNDYLEMVENELLEEEMNKSELIEALAERKNLSFKKSEEIINTIFDSMAEALQGGERIEIRGFGSFVIKDYKPYVGRNPKTGEAIKVKPKKLPFFKVGKELKEMVDN